MESEVGQLPVTHQAWAWFEANKKPTLWGVGVVLVAGLVVAFVLYRQNEQEVVASEALSAVSFPQLSAAGERPDMPGEYLKVAAAYPKSGAGARAVLLAAGGYFVEGKYEEAKTQFERFRRGYGDSPLLAQALLGIAACLDAQGKTNEAVTAYKELIDRRVGEHVLPQAQFALARLYEGQNQPERARNLYEDVERTDPYGSLADESRMRLEELRMKYPNLAAPVAATPMSALPSAAPNAPRIATPTNAVSTAAPSNTLRLKVGTP